MSGVSLLSSSTLADARQALEADPENRWYFLFVVRKGKVRAAFSPDAFDFQTYQSFEADGDVIAGEVAWEGEQLVLETDNDPGDALAALAEWAGEQPEAATVRSTATPPPPPPGDPYPVLRALFNALLVSPAPWDFMYVPADPEQLPVFELYPEGADPGIALGFLMDGRQVFSGTASFNFEGILVLEVADGATMLPLLREDYGFAFAIFDTVIVNAPPVDAPPAAAAPRKMPSAADVTRLRGMLKTRAGTIQKGDTGKFVFFASAADGLPLLVLSKPGVAVEAAMRLAGETIAAEGDYRCPVPGGIEFSNSPSFDFAAVSAELGLKFRFAKA